MEISESEFEALMKEKRCWYSDSKETETGCDFYDKTLNKCFEIQHVFGYPQYFMMVDPSEQ